MLVSQESAAAFLAFATNLEYMSGMGHRVAALEDSRLLPLVEDSFQGCRPNISLERTREG